MITSCSKARYQSRIAETPEDVAAAQALRHLAFHGVPGMDCDAFDPKCLHMLVEEMCSGRLVCCFRFLPLRDGSGIGQSHAAQQYDLSALSSYSDPMVEMGRFCVDPDLVDPDILRVAWGAMTAHVDASGVKVLFGCASFAGTDAGHYLDSFAMLRARHLAPSRWMPGIKAPDVFRFAQQMRCPLDERKAMQRMPPLLRTYLRMGGWVSDHAVVDCRMNTLHVFTAVEIDAIPPMRKRFLRATAG